MEQKEKTLYRCGTLTYTKVGLVNLAVWLLWGDFSLILLNNVFPALTPLQLNLHNASNATIGLLMGTIPSIVTFTIAIKVHSQIKILAKLVFFFLYLLKIYIVLFFCSIQAGFSDFDKKKLKLVLIYEW